MKNFIAKLTLSLCSLAALAAQAYPGRPGWHGDRTTVRCESNDYRPNRCFAGGPIGFAKIRNQHSNSPCIEGRTWGYNGRAIWVSQGCRASFDVFYRR